jgi:hypothetical protein
MKTAAEDRAIEQAAANGFTLERGLTNRHGALAVCVDTATEKYLELTVQITDETETAFAHLVSDSVMKNSVTAVVRIRPREVLALGYTIVALNPASCSGTGTGATFGGNAFVKVCGGGIFSNGCLRGGIQDDKEVEPDTLVLDFDCGAVSDGIYYGKGYFKIGGFSPEPKSAEQIPEEAYDLEFTPQELCARDGAHKVDAKDLEEELEPGLWCISGDLTVNGSKGGSLSGDGVTLVFLNGSLRCNGNCNLNLKAPAYDPDPYPAVPGLLMYSMVQTDWVLNGNNNSNIQGTILLPKADVTLNGNGDEILHRAQLIAWNFKVDGTNKSIYRWNDEVMFSEPVKLDLWR